MKTKPIIALTAAVALCAGCVGTGPNTENGVVEGGVLGAIAGAIIGNNSAGHNGAGGAAIGALAGAIAGGAIGNSVDHQNGTIYRSEYEATTNYAEPQVPPPPAPPEDVVTQQPTPSAAWIAGYYGFDGYRYYWVGGHWEIPPPNYRVFIRPHWVYRNGAYIYVRGYWR